MADRRMFSKTIIDSDAFLEMPLSTQCLYFHLSMRADDDGFVNNPKKIQRVIGASDDDFKLLIAKRFLILFDSGVVVIKHWKIHNYIQNDRYKETVYLEEKGMLSVKQNKAYSLKDNCLDTPCIQDVSKTDNQVRLGKYSIGKYSIDKNSIDKDSEDKDIEKDTEAEASSLPQKEAQHVYGEYKHVKLKDSDLNKLVNDYGQLMTEEAIQFLDEYIEMKGYKAKNHYLCIKKWVVDAVKEKHSKKKTNNKPGTAEALEESYRMMRDWAQSSGG